MPDPAPQNCDIAIIGAGFCGSLIAAHLALKAGGPLRIILIDKSPVAARGIAYGTLDPTHILNVPAIEMGAYADQPDHFYNWLEEHQTSWRHLDPGFAELEVTPISYLPRHLYGFYLSNVLKEASEEASERDIFLELIHDEAIDIERTLCQRLEISLASGGKVETQKVILAVGMPGSVYFCSKDLPNYTSSLWSMRRNNPLKGQALHELPKDYKVVLLGTGLTMLDAMSSLIERGFPGKILAISKHAKLPEKHKTHSETPFDAFDPQNPPKTALGLLKALRRAARRVDDWRSSLDAFRPHTIATWMQLPLAERKKVFKWLLSFWNRHRHRIPGMVSGMAADLASEGRLELFKGKILSVESVGAQLCVKYLPPDSDKPEQLSAHQAINCTGPEWNIEKNSTALIQNLLKRGFIIPHPTGIGLDVLQDGMVKGPLEDCLYVIGQLRMGELFETTAVPELRVQCAQLSEIFLSLKAGV